MTSWSLWWSCRVRCLLSFTNYSLAWSTTSGSVSILIVRLFLDFMWDFLSWPEMRCTRSWPQPSILLHWLYLYSRRRGSYHDVARLIWLMKYTSLLLPGVTAFSQPSGIGELSISAIVGPRIGCDVRICVKNCLRGSTHAVVLVLWLQ